jgi:hypothetical protein
MSKNNNSSTKHHIPLIQEGFILQNETVLLKCVESILVSINYNNIVELNQPYQQPFAYAAEKSVFSANKCMKFDGKLAMLAGEIITNSRAKFPPSARHCFSTQDPGHLYNSTT